MIHMPKLLRQCKARGVRPAGLIYLRPKEKWPPALLLSAGSLLLANVKEETREELQAQAQAEAEAAAMVTTRSTNAVTMAGWVCLPLAPRYHASILSSHSQSPMPCAVTISSMEARKSWYGSVESNATATPSPKDEDVAAAAASAWAEAARGRRRAGGRAGGFLSRMELEGPWGSNRRRSSERSPRTMASAMSSAAAKASDSVDWLSDAQSAWCVVVRAEELAKDDSPESRKRDAMVLAVADGVRKYWVVLGFLQEGHIHAGGAAAGGDGGGVSWAELVV